MDIEKVLLDEKVSLREELQHLKLCQLRYFVLSITVTGVIFGIGSKTEELEGAMFLAPLVVILPCWWIFFDKAKTISRIIGYYRILENMVNGKGKYLYRGWENALSEFRRWQMENKLIYNNTDDISKYGKLSVLVLLKMPHRYWVINWYAYSISSLLSVVIALHFNYTLSIVLSILSIIIICISAISTGKLLMKLVYGQNSYAANEQFWGKILSL